MQKKKESIFLTLFFNKKNINAMECRNARVLSVITTTTVKITKTNKNSHRLILILF